ncbi:hypothetical protein PVL29_009722 [Vitis rotundifolia]|uniref:Dirigent protein n=1 Tax=Vitis rotundifolia TaxID=103349 RepID=A0AA39DRW5_VITRO|nr:hypothetical protein PVL29_009722 [Vitis rotundifolia]
MTSKSATVFCAEFMMDDPLTVGPEPSSKLVRRAQGIYASASQEEMGLLMYFQCFGPKHHLFKGAGDADRRRADGEICILGTICFLGMYWRIYGKSNF